MTVARRLLPTLAFLALAHSGSASSAEVPRIGVLMPETVRPLLEPALRDGLREVGYVEGQSIRINWQLSSDAPNDLRQIVDTLVRSNVDLIITTTTPEARAVLDTTKTVPLVFQAGDPVGTGLVASLAKPGGNATGVSTVSPDLTAKRLDLLRQLLPRANRIAVLGNPANPLNVRHLEEARSAARALRFSLETYGARDIAELDSALAAIQRSRPDAFLATADLFLLGQRAKITAALRKSRLPCVLPYSEFHDTGALMTYGYSLRWVAHRTALYVDKILRGANPADTPVEQLTKFELVIDLRVARDLELKIPETLLYRADQVLQ